MTTRTWTGGGTTDHMSEAANWGGTAPVAGDDLVFAGSVRTSPVNDFPADTAFGSISFNDSAFNTSGNRITLTGGLSVHGYASAWINFNIVISGSVNFYSENTLIVAGDISGTGDVTVNGYGGGGVITYGTNTYNGDTYINTGFYSNNGSSLSSTTWAVNGVVCGTGTYHGNIHVTNVGKVDSGEGSSTGNMTVLGSFVMESGGIFNTDLAAPSGGDSVTAASADLGGATLAAGWGGSESTTGNVFTLVSASSISGVFNGLLDNATLSVGSRTLRINYTSTTVTLTDVTPPPATTWTGGGTTDNWSDSGNWSNGVPVVGSSLTFDTSSRTTPVNDLTPGMSFYELVFPSASVSYTLTGNSITLAGSITAAGGMSNEIAMDIALVLSTPVSCFGGDLTMSGSVSGAGGIQKNGTASLLLTGNSGYTGATVITDGTISIGNGGSGGTLSGTSGVSGSGTLAFNCTSDLQQGMGITSVLTGGISVVQRGTGTVVLNASNNYTGTTTVQSGVLELAGTSSSSQVTVQSGAILHGGATISGGLTVDGGSTVDPGVGIGGFGTFTAASVSLSTGSTFSVNVDGIGPNEDKIVGVGAVSLGSATLTVVDVANSVTGYVYPIVSAASVTGTFNGLADNATFVVSSRTIRINYTSTTVTLTDVTSGGGTNYNFTGGAEPVVLADSGYAFAYEVPSDLVTGVLVDSRVSFSITWSEGADSAAELAMLLGRSLLANVGVEAVPVCGFAAPAGFDVSGGVVSPAAVGGVASFHAMYSPHIVVSTVYGVVFHIPYQFGGGIIVGTVVGVSFTAVRVSAASKEAEYEKTGYRSMFGVLIYALNCESMQDIGVVPNGGSFLVSHTFAGVPGDPFHDYGAGPDYIGTKVVDPSGSYLVFRPPVPNETVWVMNDPEAPL